MNEENSIQMFPALSQLYLYLIRRRRYIPATVKDVLLWHLRKQHFRELFISICMANVFITFFSIHYQTRRKYCIFLFSKLKFRESVRYVETCISLNEWK